MVNIYHTLWIQVPPNKILYPLNCTLSAFLAATWIHIPYIDILREQKPSPGRSSKSLKSYGPTSMDEVTKVGAKELNHHVSYVWMWPMEVRYGSRSLVSWLFLSPVYRGLITDLFRGRVIIQLLSTSRTSQYSYSWWFRNPKQPLFECINPVVNHGRN